MSSIWLSYVFLPPQFPGLCLHPLDVMALLQQNRLASEEDLDPFLRRFPLLKVSAVHKIYGAADFSKQIIAEVIPPSSRRASGLSYSFTAHEVSID